MLVRILSRCGVASCLIALVSGCSLMGPDIPPQRQTQGQARGGDCNWNRSGCMYEGAYEPGERAYAEQEARRLNRAASERLRRRSIW